MSCGNMLTCNRWNHWKTDVLILAASQFIEPISKAIYLQRLSPRVYENANSEKECNVT